MILSKEDLIEGFKQLGIKKGDILLIHSSLKSLGWVKGGQYTVIDALNTCLEEEGTLVVPSLTGKREDSPCNPPVFHVEKTPCWTGIIPETVRKMQNSVRSCHPTHSVAALGYNKYVITKGHENTKSPCDENSPYFNIAKLNGFILLLGVDQESNTSIHSCEEMAQVPYHLQKEYTEIIIEGYNGEKIKVKNRLHNWDKPPTNFNKLEPMFYEKGIMRTLPIGNSVARLINAKNMMEYTIEKLRKEPLFLLCSNK